MNNGGEYVKPRLFYTKRKMSEYVSVIGDSIYNYDEALKIILRIRPPFKDEKDDLSYFEVVSSQQLDVKIPYNSWTYKNMKRGKSEASLSFEFANIYDWSAPQERVFSGLIDGVILDFLSGRNGLLFTYGITNSGKTYTLIGKPTDFGILPRTLEYIFTCLQKHDLSSEPLYKQCPYKGVIESDPQQISIDLTLKKNILENYTSKTLSWQIKNNNESNLIDTFNCDEFEQTSYDQVNIGIDMIDIPDGANTTFYLYLSVAEIYNEQVFDLLELPLNENNSKRPSLKINGDQKNGFFIKHLKNILICSTMEALRLLQLALSNRKISSTRMNINSSRSHVIYTLTMIRTTKLPNDIVVSKYNQICFVDLAGAERQSNTLNIGERFQEACNINKSLLSLHRCLQEMRNCRSNYSKNYVLPFRESKLTQLLQPFFIGRCRMILLINISPSLSAFDDTISVLKLSSITREALNRPIDTELNDALTSEAVINNSSALDLKNCSKLELIEIIHNLRKRIIDNRHNIDSIDSILRQDMCQFTMQMLSEIQEDHEKQISLQRKLVVESYLTKIELLNDEIEILHNQIKSHNSSQIIDECEMLKQQLILKEEQFEILMSDVNTFKNDTQKEIETLKNKNNELFTLLSEKESCIQEHINSISIIKKQLVDSNSQITELKELCERPCGCGPKIELLAQSKSQLEDQNNFLKKKISTIAFTFKNKLDDYRQNLSLLNKESQIIFKNNLSSIGRIKSSLIQLDKIFSYHKSQSDKIPLLDKQNKHLERRITQFKEQTLSNFKKITNSLDSITTNFNAQNIKNDKRLDNMKSKIDIIFKVKENLLSHNLSLKKKNQELSEELEKERANLSSVNNNVKNLSQKISDYKTQITDLETMKENYLIKIETLNNDLSKVLKNYEQLKAEQHGNKNTDTSILNLETELKGYKKLNEEYRQQIEKLENLITERKILASTPVLSIPQPQKRPLSSSVKENYSGLFCKKNNREKNL